MHRLLAEATDARHPAHHWLSSRRDLAVERLQALYADAIEGGELPPDTDANALAMMTFGAWDGIERQRLSSPARDWRPAGVALRRLIEALAGSREVSRPS